jgi:hypothetical protein
MVTGRLAVALLETLRAEVHARICHETHKAKARVRRT